MERVRAAATANVLSDNLGEGYLRAQRLTKSFGQTSALRGVSITLGRSEVVAILGPSGSGKSTLLHCLSGLENPDSGQVLVDEHRLDSLGEPGLTLFRRRHFGYVFQFPALIPELSGLDNVSLPAWLSGVKRRVAQRGAQDLLHRLGVAHVADHVPGQMSGGEAQRVAIARALVTRPSILFADEPTGSLDTKNAENVAQLLVETAREHGCAVLLVTHDPAMASISERQLRMRDGVLENTQ